MNSLILVKRAAADSEATSSVEEDGLNVSAHRIMPAKHDGLLTLTPFFHLLFDVDPVVVQHLL